jgi:sec-independent protein translocase protein TatC
MSHDQEQSIWDHLEEFATRLRRALTALALATFVIMMAPSDPAQILKLNFSDYRPLISSILEFIQESLLPGGVDLIAFNWLDPFYIYFLVAFIIAFLVTLPYLSWELYKFITPALYEHERKGIFTFVIVVVLLFGVGAAYAWFLLLPTTFSVLYNFVSQSRVLPFFAVKDFYNMVAFGLLGSGIFYTFPVIIWIIVKADLLEVESLKRNRKQLFVGLLFVTAILSPDPTPFTMLLMSVPFYILYEITIQILQRTTPDPEKKAIQAGLRASERFLTREKAREEAKTPDS